MKPGLHVEGGRELQHLLRELPKRIERKANRAAVTAAIRPMMRGLKAKSPRQSGLTRKSIGRKVKGYRRAVVATAGARHGVEGSYKGRKRVPARYWHLLNVGTQPHGGHPGTEARNMVAETYRQHRDEAQRLAAAKHAEVVLTEARKLGR